MYKKQITIKTYVHIKFKSIKNEVEWYFLSMVGQKRLKNEIAENFKENIASYSERSPAVSSVNTNLDKTGNLKTQVFLKKSKSL